MVQVRAAAVVAVSPAPPRRPHRRVRPTADSAAGLPLPNHTVALGSNGSFHDRVGAGETNLYLLSTDGACDAF